MSKGLCFITPCKFALSVGRFFGPFDIWLRRSFYFAGAAPAPALLQWLQTDETTQSTTWRFRCSSVNESICVPVYLAVSLDIVVFSVSSFTMWVTHAVLLLLPLCFRGFLVFLAFFFVLCWFCLSSGKWLSERVFTEDTKNSRIFYGIASHSYICISSLVFAPIV